jgi:hypothetical protein
VRHAHAYEVPNFFWWRTSGSQSLRERPLLELKRALSDAVKDAPPRTRFTNHGEGNNAPSFRAADEHERERFREPRGVAQREVIVIDLTRNELPSRVT